MKKIVVTLLLLAAVPVFATAPERAIDGEQGKLSPGAGPSVVVVETEKGTFEFETYPNEAPKTVAHILGLIQKRFYNGQRIQRFAIASPGAPVRWCSCTRIIDTIIAVSSG